MPVLWFNIMTIELQMTQNLIYIITKVMMEVIFYTWQPQIQIRYDVKYVLESEIHSIYKAKNII